MASETGVADVPARVSERTGAPEGVRFEQVVIDRAMPEEGVGKVMGLMLCAWGDVEVLKGIVKSCEAMQRGLEAAVQKAVVDGKEKIGDGRRLELARAAAGRWERVGNLVRRVVRDLMADLDREGRGK
jgi:hypothetical protein